MSSTVYGRKAIRQMESETGARIVHAANNYLTTIGHRHYVRMEVGQVRGWMLIDGICGLPTPVTSCSMLFGLHADGVRRTNFMLGRCTGDSRGCDAGPDAQHAHDCPLLLELLTWPSINPDYWPRPVHRPMWVDDGRYRGASYWRGIVPRCDGG